MRKFFAAILFSFMCLPAHSQRAMPADSLVGFYKLDGNSKPAGGKAKPGKMQGVKPASDRFGDPGKACALSCDFKASNNKRSFISIPLDINPKKHPLLTI